MKVRGVNSLPRELHIIVNFDDQGQAIGEAQALLTGFLGTLAADCKLFPMDYDRWSGPSGVPKTYFDDCFETILKVCQLVIYNFLYLHHLETLSLLFFIYIYIYIYIILLNFVNHFNSSSF